MLYAEDLHDGQEFPFSGYPVHEGEMLEFATRFDPVPMHVDPEAAAASQFGGLIASGLHTMAIYQRLIVDALWSRTAVIAGRGLNVRLSRPVRAGMVLSGRAQIERITPRPERGDAIVIVRSEVTDETGRTVLAVELDALVHARPAPG